MLLLITFIAHSLINYFNKRIKSNRRTLRVDPCTARTQPDDETEMFLFNESSFDNLAAQFDYSTVIRHTIINSTFDSLLLRPEIHDINEEEYFELNTQQQQQINTTNSTSLNLTEKNYEFELNSTINSDDNESSTCSDSIYLSDLTMPKLTAPVVVQKSKSFRYSYRYFNKSLSRVRLNRYLKSRSLIIDANSSLDSFPLLNKRRFSARLSRRQFRKRTSTLRSHNVSLQSSHSSDSLVAFTFSSRRSSLVAQTNQTYKPPTKIEKLLNDTRGMRKYLIDYDCLMSNNQCAKTNNESTNRYFNGKYCSSFLNDDADLVYYQSSSNRCSSGYLSDC